MRPRLMRPRLVLASVLLAAAGSAAPASAQSLAERYRGAADRIIRTALADSAAYRRLAELTDRFGHRLSGSPGLEQALDWMLAEMRRDGLEGVQGEPVLVPRWVRGEEAAELVEPRRAPLSVLGLGGTIGTPRGGITAEVMVVASFDELARRAGEARGRIVLFDMPWNGYGATVQYRWAGAIAAARAGAVASLIRSVTPVSLGTPHTGVMTYDSTVPRIPHAALTVEDAALIRRMVERGQRVVVRLALGARTLPDAPSRNVVAELRGSELPHEVVVMGGHTDSWDVGTGAMDDAGGVVAAWEALRLLQRLGLRARRTIRVVGWVNEENGGRGGEAYRDAHADEYHVLAFESDNGVFRPHGIGFSGSDSARALVRDIARLLGPLGADSVTAGGGGADVAPLMQRGVPGMSPNVDGSRYFWYHHSPADTVDKLDPGDMSRLVALMAVMTYVVADMPDRLPRAVPASP